MFRISSGGRITIPVEMRRALELNEGDRVEFEISGNELKVRKWRSYAERSAGILAAYRLDPPLSIDEEREAFEQAVVEDALNLDF